MDVTPEGRTYSERYQVQDFPHIGFIDPRTGRLLLRKEGWTQQNPLTAESFAEIAMDFCSRNSFDRPPQAPRPVGAVTSRPAKRPMHEMSEAEQLQAAMRASLEDHATDSKDNESAIVDIVDISDADDIKPAANPIEISPPSANEELLTTTIPDEPASGARLQFKLPDGKRIVRMFSGSDRVKMIYAYIAVSRFVTCEFYHTSLIPYFNYSFLFHSKLMQMQNLEKNLF
jgi:UBX domain-containing protein 7